MAPFRYTFSRPVNSGWKPAPSSSSADRRPSTVAVPSSGRRMPASTFSSVLLPEPLPPMIPKVEPWGTSRSTPRRAQNSS